MPETLTHLTPEATTAPVEFTPDWHRQQEREERAWLDDFARTRNLVTAA